jgi:hypothetical protein
MGMIFRMHERNNIHKILDRYFQLKRLRYKMDNINGSYGNQTLENEVDSVEIDHEFSVFQKCSEFLDQHSNFQKTLCIIELIH